MSFELLIALAGFAFIASITPGPNNLMLMASAANFGLRRTIPHMLGVDIGFVILLFFIGLGLSGLFEILPFTRWVLTIFSIAYLLWLAWKIAHAAPPEKGEPAGRPFTFLQAALFQWVNPKAWTMALMAVTLYAPDRSLAMLLWLVAVFGIVNVVAIVLWSVLGSQASRWLSEPRYLRAFNWTMAALLVASLIPVLGAILS